MSDSKKLSTDDKLALVTSAAVAGLEAKKSIDSICVELIGAGIIQEGLGFTEIAPLVKQVGIAKGLIVPLAQRKENYKSDLESMELPRTYEEYEEKIQDDANEYDIPAGFVKNSLNGSYKKYEVTIPQKEQLNPWQVSIIKAFSMDANISQEGLEMELRRDEAKCNNPKHYARLTHLMISKVLRYHEVIN